jgi:hypothetical protein
LKSAVATPCGVFPAAIVVLCETYAAQRLQESLGASETACCDESEYSHAARECADDIACDPMNHCGDLNVNEFWKTDDSTGLRP